MPGAPGKGSRQLCVIFECGIQVREIVIPDQRAGTLVGRPVSPLVQKEDSLGYVKREVFDLPLDFGALQPGKSREAN